MMMMSDAAIAAALRVPFLSRGRSRDGWDCFGVTYVEGPAVYGFTVPRCDGFYEGTGAKDAAQLSHAIACELVAFEEGPPGPDFPILTFERFGFRSHTALCIGGGYMLHADNAGEAGGTYCQRYDYGPWARPRRRLRAFRPAGWRLDEHLRKAVDRR